MFLLFPLSIYFDYNILSCLLYFVDSVMYQYFVKIVPTTYVKLSGEVRDAACCTMNRVICEELCFVMSRMIIHL